MADKLHRPARQPRRRTVWCQETDSLDRSAILEPFRCAQTVFLTLILADVRTIRIYDQVTTIVLRIVDSGWAGTASSRPGLCGTQDLKANTNAVNSN